MEAVGLGVGVLGLAGLFSACIDCFELVQRGRYFGREYLLLETKFSNQRFRLRSWGRACGFGSQDGYDKRIDQGDTKDLIENTLVHLLKLLDDGTELQQRYGLIDVDKKGTSPSSAAVDLVTRKTAGITLLGRRLQHFGELAKWTSKRTQLKHKTRWAIEDQRKFQELVQHLKDLIDDLEGFTRWLDVPTRQKDIIRSEVASIYEIPRLEAMEEARLGDHDAISYAASHRLWELHGQHIPEDRTTVATDNPIQEAPNDSNADDWEEISNGADHAPDVLADARFQILHRIHCSQDSTRTYFDPPSYRIRHSNENQWVLLGQERITSDSRSFHLCGGRELADLDAYLQQNNQVLFVSLIEYYCRHGPDSSGHSNSEAFSHGQSIHISSAKLCNALRALPKKTWKLSCLPVFKPGTEFSSPYLWFYHKKQVLQESLVYLDEEERSLVQVMLDFLGESTSEEFAEVERLLSMQKMSWGYLQYLFAPGDVLLEHFNPDTYQDRSQAYEQIGFPRLVPAIGTSPPSLELRVRSLVFSGGFKWVYSVLKLSKHLFGNDDEAAMALLSISVLSLRTVGYDRLVSRDLIRRGKRFWKCSQGRFVTYSGPTADSGEEIQSDSRFMVDMLTYQKLHPIGEAINRDFDVNQMGMRNPSSAYFPADELYWDDSKVLLLPPTIFGFDMHEHQWKELFLSRIEQLRRQSTKFDYLVMDQDKKDEMAALFTTNATEGSYVDSDFDFDLYPNSDSSKQEPGRRLLVLFQGPPGTGKTLAAEAVAELSGRPLYRLNMSDIGKTASDLNKCFNTTLPLVYAWNCILLIEDIDVLGGNRIGSDVTQISLISEFLRLLDRFTGTLVLATNPRLRLDEAMGSRVSNVFQFPVLEGELRKTLWANVFKKLGAEDEASVRLPSELADECAARMSNLEGRAIEYVAYTAVRRSLLLGEELDYNTVARVYEQRSGLRF